MSLIQRQDGIVRVLENLYRRKWQNPGRRSRAVRKVAEFNTKRMVFAGYTPDEAKASFRQCVDMAVLNLNAEVPA
ncbi:hypothetical protein [Hydrogenophaga defluvii]|uniref:Uncharacterized protein n=1 Tax=Hydrogenophaga defluvii TaxID=249410 RepID=A0ABW2SC55_9BURK